MDWDVIVIGAGAAGILAASRAAERGRRTALLEKNRRPGVKILISGGTRCNLTHDCGSRDIVAAFGAQGRFLHSALAALDPHALRALVEAEGVPTKVEPGGKVFPVSNRAMDVLAGLLDRLARSGASLHTDCPVTELRRDGDLFRVVARDKTWTANKVIVTTGGKSYPGCGTTGDGYAWLASFGHTIVPPRPALTPLTVDDAWVRRLAGITLPDVTLTVVDPEAPPAGKRTTLAERRGSLLFTHFGLSGPVALDVSRAVSGHADPRQLQLICDFAPQASASSLADALLREVQVYGKRRIGGIACAGLPQRFCEELLLAAGIDPAAKAAEFSKAGRARWIEQLKHCTLAVSGTRGFEKAEVTAGGVALDEVDSRTMQSKRVPNLYLAGEVLDLDGPIGGYNFQSAFSTGWLAGESV